MPKLLYKFHLCSVGPANGTALHGEYIPVDPTEREAYDALWSIANPSGGVNIDASAAVEFMRQSLLDLDLLRTIWGLSTSDNYLDKRQFFCVLRYISMAQNGIKDISRGCHL